MQHVRPLHLDAPISSGVEWLVSPDEGAECTIRICRAGREAGPVEPSSDERFLFVVRGALRLAGGETDTAEPGETIFVPVQTDAVVDADAGSIWLEIAAPLPVGKTSLADEPAVLKLDHAKFEGQGFAWQSIVDRKMGAQALRMNAMHVQPGTGSPDYHIHNFSQYYVIQEGVMTVDIGHKRFQAGPNALVYLPQGVVHRNFNASGAVEKHISLLIPEPEEGKVFDYSVTIHDHEASFLQEPPLVRTP